MYLLAIISDCFLSSALLHLCSLSRLLLLSLCGGCCYLLFNNYSALLQLSLTTGWMGLTKDLGQGRGKVSGRDR